jgi:hypothetical protein
MKMRIHILILAILLASPGISSQSKINNPLYLINVSDNYSNSPSLHLFKNFREQKFNVQVIAINGVLEWVLPVFST